MISEKDFFNKIYCKGFEESCVNQLLKLYADGYDLSYIDITTDRLKLRQLRDKLNDPNEEIRTIYEKEIEAKKDILKFVDGNYSAYQIYSINEMEKEYDISLLLNPNYNDNQFKILANCIKRGYDITWFADPKIPEDNMTFFADALKMDINLSKFKYGYNVKQLGIILSAKKAGIDTTFLENPKLSERQMIILVEAKKTTNINLLDYVNEDTDEYKLLELKGIASKDIEILNKIKENKYDFNIGQLSVINYFLNQNKNIDEILNIKYSPEKMKLIMESNGKIKEIIKNSTSNDLNLHLFKYNFIENPENVYEDINEFKNSIIKKEIKEYNFFLKSPDRLECKTQSYYINNKEILEIEKVHDAKLPLFFEQDNMYPINEFGPYEIEKLLSKNQEKVFDFLNKYCLMEYDENNKKLKITSLINGKSESYKSPDLKILFSYQKVASYFYTKFNSLKEYDDTAYDNKIAHTLAKAFILFEKIGIDPNEDYLIEDIKDDNGNLFSKLCIEKEKIPSYFKTKEKNEEMAKLELITACDRFETCLHNTQYRMTFYDHDGIVIDDDDELYTRRMINDILWHECNSFEYFGEFKSIDKCIEGIKEEEEWYYDEEL